MEQLRDLFDAGWSFGDAYVEAFGDDDTRYEEAREKWGAWAVDAKT